MSKDSGIVKIHGKEYKTVALRVSEFRDVYSIADGWGITTDIHTINSEYVVVKASILSPGGSVVAVGHAEEKWATSNINKTSAVENCETSAIGRALAAAGLAGTEYASADEVANAIKIQQAQKQVDELARVEKTGLAAATDWANGLIQEIRLSVNDKSVDAKLKDANYKVKLERFPKLIEKIEEEVETQKFEIAKGRR